MSEWISVDDRMPERIGLYIFHGTNNGAKETGMLFFNSNRQWCDGNEYYPGEITHWMPLPPPPKEKA